MPIFALILKLFYLTFASFHSIDFFWICVFLYNLFYNSHSYSCVSDPQAAKDLVFGNCGVLQEINTTKVKKKQ